METTFALRTDRLLLRDFVPTDVERVHAFASEPEVTRFTEWFPRTIKESDAFVRERIEEARAPDRTAFELAVVTVADDLLVGSAAIWVESAVHRRGELGIALHPSVWGRGCATEAGRELIRFGFAKMGLQRVAATCHPDNVGCAQSMVKVGMRLEGHLRDHLRMSSGPRDSLLFAILPSDLPPP